MHPSIARYKQEHLGGVKQDEVVDGAALGHVKTLNLKFEGRQKERVGQVWD